MSSFAFLDTWALVRYTKPDAYDHLSGWVHRTGLTVLVNSLSLIELYNPRGSQDDRCARVARFLGRHSCAIVKSTRVFDTELKAFPQSLSGLPIELDLNDIPAEHRVQALELFLRRDRLYLQQGKDIKEWAAEYEKTKSEWSADVSKILEHACKEGVLHRDRRGRLRDLAASKEAFLQSLDLRHLTGLTRVELEGLGPALVDLVTGGGTAKLPAIRTSSLCFWYAYVDTDPAFPMKRKGSDLGDFLQMSLLPYCTIFTADTTMDRMLKRILSELPTSCTVLNRSEVEVLLQSGKLP
ncbi:MAG TPA: hypothetical protein VHR45_20795 [Thermoanaerobaculia bacterium]|nr:hypothetical protein [Thermoanaerobaculia bacterium]